MVDAGKYYSNDPIRGQDLSGPLEVTIAEVADHKDRYNPDAKQLLVTFTDDQQFIAKAKQIKMLVNATGGCKNTDDWIGHTVVLIPENITINDQSTGQQKDVVTINVRAAQDNSKERAATIRKDLKARAAAKPKPASGVGSDLDDDLDPPF